MNSPTINQANDPTPAADFDFSHIHPLGFRDLCLRTLAPGTIGKCRQILNDFDLLHGVLGFVSEVGELQEATFRGDRINIAEEVGDVMWYVYLVAHELRINLETAWRDVAEQCESDSPVFSLDNLHNHGAWLCDTIKRRVFYQAETPKADKLTLKLGLILRCLDDICRGWTLSLHECQAKVIRKLAKRYPESFSDLHAANRDLQSERAALES